MTYAISTEIEHDSNRCQREKYFAWMDTRLTRIDRNKNKDWKLSAGTKNSTSIPTLSSCRRICIIWERNDSSIHVNPTVSTSNWHIDRRIISHWRILKTLGGNKELTLYPVFSSATRRIWVLAQWIGIRSDRLVRWRMNLSNRIGVSRTQVISARLNYIRFLLIVRSVKNRRERQGCSMMRSRVTDIAITLDGHVRLSSSFRE